MALKMLLKSSYGGYVYPKGFLDSMNGFYTASEYAQGLYKFVEGLGLKTCTFPDGVTSEELIEQIEKSEHGIIKTDFNGMEYITCDEKGLCVYYVEDVDTSRLWSFDTYDGAEFIRYYELRENNQLKVVTSN